MELKATKGEWHLEDYATMLDVSCKGHGSICMVESDYVLSEGLIDPTPEQLANAHLIASAPRLYRVLERVSQLRDLEGGYAIQWILDNTDGILLLLEDARGE